MRYKEKAHMGQKLCTESGPSRDSHKVDQHSALMGRNMGGGPLDTSHSLKGAGDVQTYNDVKRASGDRGKKKMSY